MVMFETKLLRCLLFVILYLPNLCFCQHTDTITSSSSLIDPNTIESLGQVFQLGFFTPPNTTNRYLGIFYTVSQETAIWVANRDRPLNDSSGYVTISPKGNLLLNWRNETVWSTNIKGRSLRNTSAQIQDTGNLLLRDASTGSIIWESFSQPSDVFLPMMRITDNVKIGTDVYISSGLSPIDPAVGNYTAGLKVNNVPQIFSWQNGHRYWRSGPWNGLTFIGSEDMYSSYMDGSSVVVNDGNGAFYFTVRPGRLMKMVLNSTGSLVQTLWSDERREWELKWLAPKNQCDIYGTCGPFGSCNMKDSPICSCLRGFEPANQEAWNRGNWTGGCVRRRQLQCGRNSNTSPGDGFFKLPFTKVPDFAEQLTSSQVDECRIKCLSNCSCIAYAHEPYISCMLWSDRLIDVQRFDGVGIDLYICLKHSELDEEDSKNTITLLAVVGLVIFSIFGCIFWTSLMQGGNITEKGSTSDSVETFVQDALGRVDLIEFPLFKIGLLANATNNFSQDNKLGMGGFGPVYRGELPDGRKIAVKRLSKASGQGLQEFMNEVELISKLQHRNLVRLLGCCVENNEKMLIYEYMPNKSLDVYLFDALQDILDWRKRFNIIEGICQGLLYLHRDSRLKIIHRDLKPSNVLLDYDWNPKISDFGMARIYETNQDHVITLRVVGTYGYMPPEYAMGGRFSEKSDVFSFGVLMLEIATGRRNTSFYHGEGSLIDLLGHVWRLWKDNNVVGLIDSRISNSSNQPEILRCMHIGLLCVQERPKDRPPMSSVLAMLSCETVELAEPKQPASFVTVGRSDTSSQHRQKSSSSLNIITLTDLYGR